MIAVGEESGALDDLMEEIADMYQRDVEYEIKTLGAKIEPIMIMFLGVLVLILALGIFLPIWDLGKASMHKVIMKLNIFHFAVASLFNFAISNGIIAILVFTVLSNINRAQSQVEVSMMETDVANIRWELRELWAHRNATGQSIAGSEIDDANPLRLVNERPKNYSGEYAEAPPELNPSGISILKPNVWFMFLAMVTRLAID